MSDIEMNLSPGTLVFVGLETLGGCATAWRIGDRMPREGDGVQSSFTSMSILDRAVLRALLNEAMTQLDNTEAFGGAS